MQDAAGKKLPAELPLVAPLSRFRHIRLCRQADSQAVTHSACSSAKMRALASSQEEPIGKNITPTRGFECSANTTTPEPETSFFASDRYEQSIRAIKGLKDTLLGVNCKLQYRAESF